MLQKSTCEMGKKKMKKNEKNAYGHSTVFGQSEFAAIKVVSLVKHEECNKPFY